RAWEMHLMLPSVGTTTMQKPPPVYDARFVLHPEADTQYVHFENSDAHPFQPRAAGMPRVNAWWLAESALLAYWNDPQAGEWFGKAGLKSESLTAKSTDCYVASHEDFVIVAFRGTQPDQWKDVLTDVKFAQVPWSVGTVHSGFAEALDA